MKKSFGKVVETLGFFSPVIILMWVCSLYLFWPEKPALQIQPSVHEKKCDSIYSRENKIWINNPAIIQ